MDSRLPKACRWICRMLIVAFGTALLSGCASTEPENASARPWNSPRGWEHGLPPGMYEGR
ncbi:MAG TPA: hypothetical protein VJW76_09710 [Verrucomicrobiae bacterium]|nr:hypothetical protein [Verrucomicrobiae bacterium]